MCACSSVCAEVLVYCESIGNCVFGEYFRLFVSDFVLFCIVFFYHLFVVIIVVGVNILFFVFLFRSSDLWLRDDF